MAELSRLLGRLDPRPDRRGREFELICKWYLENDPPYRNRLRKVWLWEEWPGRWGRDAGIDLIAEDVDGSVWAIQAKAYDTSYSVKKSDVDTFLSESARPGIAFRLLVATTNRFGAQATRTIAEQEKPASVLMLADLERSHVMWPSDPGELRPAKPAPKEPLPHNRIAIDAVCDGFATRDRGQLLMACGTGKTLVALWVAERLRSERTLVLVPSLSLLAHTLREWTSNATIPFRYLLLCSDESVAAEDHFTQHTSELGLPTTTNPEDVRQVMQSDGRLVLFSTYHSSPRVAEAFTRGMIPGFDLAIADEAHRCAGLVGDFGTILDARKIRADRRLFMTATPRIFAKHAIRAAKDDGFTIASMDNEEHFGPIFHRLPFSEAIRDRLLTPYQVAIVGVSDARYRKYVEEGRLVAAHAIDPTDARSLAGQIAVAKSLKQHNLSQVVTFHSRVRSAREFSEKLPAVINWLPVEERPSGSVWSDYVSGAMSSGQRETRLNRLRRGGPSERAVLSNARCLGEGVDVPSLDGVAFIEPRGSQVDIVQAVGRAIRKHADKTVSTILLPVFVSEGEDAQVVLDESAFKGVWMVLRALCAHDETLAAELASLRRSLGRLSTGRIDLPDRIYIDLPIEVSEAFLQAFTVRLVEETTSLWEFFYGLLELYAGREGHCIVPQDHFEEGRTLGVWVGTQRVGLARGILSPERSARLENLPGWSWNVMLNVWDQRFAVLEHYVRREGTSLVPSSHVEDDVPLGDWLVRQRVMYRRGALTENRIARLEGLPGWTWEPLEDGWNATFGALHDFSLQNGHVRVPRDLRTEDGVSLSSWMVTQQSDWRAGRLTEARCQRLETLHGWRWREVKKRSKVQPRLSAKWDAAFDLLVGWLAGSGGEVPSGYSIDGVNLYDWVNLQRSLHNRGRLQEDRTKRLEELDGWQWRGVIDGKWQESFDRLAAYATANGTAAVPFNWGWDDGYRLGVWVTAQRTKFKEGRLRKDQIKALESLPGWRWKAFRTD